MVYGPKRGQWFTKPPSDQTSQERWPKTSAGLSWYEIPISSAFTQEKWDQDPVTAAFRMKRLIFGVAPDHYIGTVGQAYKVMRETWRKWGYPQKGRVTHVQLREGGSWHFSNPQSLFQDAEVHLTFEFFGTDAHGRMIKLNGTIHGYQQDAVDFDDQFRAQFAAHVTQQNATGAAQGKQPQLSYDNKCGTLDWVPDPNNFDSLHEHENEIREHIDYIVNEGAVTQLTANMRLKYPQALPTYPGLPQHLVNSQATIVPAAPPLLRPQVPPPPNLAGMNKKKRFPQTSQIPPPGPGGASGAQTSNTGTGTMASVASAIGQASLFWGRWSPYSLGARAQLQKVQGIYAKVAVGRPRAYNYRPATMWGGRLLSGSVAVQPSPA